ncbi:MAG TPA: glycoside hydrolase family 31 protein [Jatrophihabitantaceae bacterium]|jgi:alpha-glucosidase (family GH31 glycosyl hydrolase)|nr:glycoside hydrolase family 31 protein [Jatrophihabitantaceae bacterium]
MSRLTTHLSLVLPAVAASALLVTAVLAAPAASAHRAHASGPQVTTTHSSVRLVVPRSAHAPGYQVVVTRSPFEITTVRAGHVVLQTTAGREGSSGPADFKTAAGWASATSVRTARWRNHVLKLTLATSVPGDTVTYRLTPGADRYRVRWTVSGSGAAQQVATHYVVASAGHWYGQGEAQTPDGGPYTRQPWPLDSGTVRDDAMGPAEYLMTDPFWFTERGTGLWVDTRNVMDVSMNDVQQGVFGYTVTDTAAMDDTVFVESTARKVYEDYVGIAGSPTKSDATRSEYAKPLWNSWAQSYTAVSQASVLDWATGLHNAGVPAQAIQVDDGWSTHYGDFDFNSKFPDPKQLSAQIHAMGDKFGLWVTLWINNDANNYAYAAAHGYLLKSKTDPSKPCSVTWWNGTAGIVDLANPDARAWYVGQLQNVEKTYGVDGFKFDTRFFDESCAPYPGYAPLDYIKLGAQVTDEFDQQGAGVRLSWTGSQKYGFVIREVDKGTGWDSLQAGVAQTLAISTIGYPFVETDMVGGSLSQPPPTKRVLVRWAQAAALMPLMYSSTSPLGVSSPAGSRSYDPETVALYKAAARLHTALAPYIDAQVSRAVRTGEPIMKPLFFDFPKDRASYSISNEWLLGDSLLAAPVLTNANSRDIHLPAGLWYDVLRHRVVSGATLTGYHAALGQTPMFIRLGSASTRRLMRMARSASADQS